MRVIARLVASLLLLASALCAQPSHALAEDAPLIIFHADSLTGYMAGLAEQFEASHRGVEVRREASGSLDAIRRVADLHLPCDIVVSADWRLLARAPAGIEPWVAIFAGNSIGILYTDHSMAAGEITADNWYRILTRPGVRYGHSNPERDPAGYWTLIVWRLAERYYNQRGLAARLDADCPTANIRPKSIDFIPLLQSGDLDYFFGYSSDANLGGLKFLRLPAQINLGDLSRASEYALTSIEVGSAAHARRIEGAPIAYGATLSSDPPNRAAAIEFLKLILGEPGRKAAAQTGLAPYPTAFAADPKSTMPPELKALCRPISQ